MRNTEQSSCDNPNKIHSDYPSYLYLCLCKGNEIVAAAALDLFTGLQPKEGNMTIYPHLFGLLMRLKELLLKLKELFFD